MDNFNLFREITISSNCLADNLNIILTESNFQLHTFCDISNLALRCVENNKTVVKFMLGKSKVVLTSKSGWVISHKELEAARMCSVLILQAKKVLERFN